MADLEMKRASISGAVQEITKAFEDWQPIDQRATKSLWGLLGKVYELGAEVETESSLKEELIAAAKLHPEIRGSNRWRPDEKTSFDIILTMTLGLNKATKATKSQWLGVMKSAEKAKIAADQTSFVNWIAGVGGIVAAQKAKAGASSARSKFNLTSFAKNLPELSGDAELFHGEIDPSTDLHEGFSVVLVQRQTDDAGRWTNDLRVIAKIGDKKLVESAAKAVHEGQTKNVIDVDIPKLEAECLFKLNAIAARAVKLTGQKMKFSDIGVFVRTARKLASIPALEQKYFDGQPGTHSHIDDRGDEYRFEVLNPTFNSLDPGRYISNAKPNALVAYKLGDDLSEARTNFFDYTRSYKEAVKEAKWKAFLEDAKAAGVEVIVSSPGA